MILCPNCGEKERIHEKPGMTLSLYKCENPICGCEFRQCEVDEVIEFYRRLEEIRSEEERLLKLFKSGMKHLKPEIEKLLGEQFELANKIGESRVKWREILSRQ